MYCNVFSAFSMFCDNLVYVTANFATLFFYIMTKCLLGFLSANGVITYIRDVMKTCSEYIHTQGSLAASSAPHQGGSKCNAM